MKNTIRAMMLGASALAFVAAPGVSANIFAQDAAAQTQCTAPERDALYNDQIRPNVGKTATPQQREAAFNSAKQYLEKYRNCDDNKEIVAYLDKYVNTTYPAYVSAIKDQQLRDRFGKAYDAKNYPEVFAAGKELLALNPADDTVITLLIVDSGYNAAKSKNDAYNAETMNYARQAIEKINSGKVTDNKYNPFSSKDEALAWMHYTMGYIAANRQNNKVEAAPHYYRAVGFNTDIKKSYLPYAVIAEAYLDQYTKAAAEYNRIKGDAAVSEDDKNKAAGMWKAYADRAAEYFARAYNVAKADPKVKPEVAKDIYNTLSEVYKLRHDQQTTGLDEFIAGFNSKPATDPSTAVTPVIEANTSNATATTAISSSASSNEAANTATRTNGSAAGTTKPAATAKPAATGSAKPAPRKKSK